jgi:phage baseplate assembly protein W
MRIAVTLAQEANKATGLPGRAKLDLVVHALRDLLATPVVAERLSPEVAATLRGLVDTVIPETISLVVEASRGAFSLKKPSIGCLAGVVALFCRQAAAHGPAQLSQIAAQVDQVAKAEKEPDVATFTTAAKDTVELTLRDVVLSKTEPSDAPTPSST